MARVNTCSYVCVYNNMASCANHNQAERCIDNFHALPHTRFAQVDKSRYPHKNIYNIEMMKHLIWVPWMEEGERGPSNLCQKFALNCWSLLWNAFAVIAEVKAASPKHRWSMFYSRFAEPRLKKRWKRATQKSNDEHKIYGHQCIHQLIWTCDYNGHYIATHDDW